VASSKRICDVKVLPAHGSRAPGEIRDVNDEIVASVLQLACHDCPRCWSGSGDGHKQCEPVVDVALPFACPRWRRPGPVGNVVAYSDEISGRPISDDGKPTL